MNLQEFAALRVGDKIENLMTGNSGQGTVTEVRDNGVSIAWGGGPPRAFSVNSTIWFHWSKVGGETDNDT